jgi:hypothetical protein
MIGLPRHTQISSYVHPHDPELPPPTRRPAPSAYAMHRTLPPPIPRGYHPLRDSETLPKSPPLYADALVNDDIDQLSRIVDGSVEMIVEVFLEGSVLFVDIRA